MKKIAILSVCLSWFACGKIWAQPDVAIFADNAFSIEIMNGDNTPDPSDFTDFGTMSLGGPDSTHLFTIASWGSEDIDVTIVSATSGTYFTAEFDSPPPPPGFFLPWTFIVTFQASSAPIGVYNAIITIESNDPDENPFTFAVRAEVTGAPPPIFPEINVQGNGMDITDGDPLPSTADGTDFGSITFGDAPVIHTFTIQNIGDDLLNVTDISLAGAGASAYSLGALDPASPVAPFEYATFTVAFDPATAGTFSATLNIANDDPDENPYNFAITGTATTPPPPPAADLEARGNNVVILNGDTSPSTVDGTDFGTNPASLMFPLNHAFMMKNIGATTIHLDTITLTGSGAAAYLLPSNPTFPDTLSPGDSTSFWVSFQPSSNGTFNATVNIANDDPNENPYTFDVTGVSAAIPGREISVSGNGVEISNNDTSPTLLDGTDFGEINQGSGASNLFYIYNLGQTILNVGSISISGANAGDFTASDLFVDPFLPPGEVPPGAGGFFSIDFNPTAVGLRQAIVTISNDDPDENPYVFYVQGTGMAALTTWYQDADGDGFGNAVVSQIAGSQPMGYVANDDDCDDSDFNVNPTATETCNGVDDNCDSQIDEGLGSTWYADSDGDSYGDPLVSQVSCSQPTGYVADDTDCDDADFNVNPSATEVCNGVDDNCDGNIDEGLGTTWYADADGDSYGDPLVSQVSCSQPTGYVADDTDCDDADFNVNPSATEVCNGVDDNCDALVDAADPNLVDNEPPTVSCQNINVSLDANGMAQIIPTQIVTLLADNCVSVSAVLSVSNFTCSNIGANPVIATAIDGSGNTATCTATVTIVDNLPPTVTCQNITVPLDASGNVVITPSQVSSGASDNCGSPVLGLNISNFSCANIGANTVTLTAIDGSNNTASCTATVTVEDNLPPTAVCQNITVPLNASGTATITPSQINNGSSDNCGLGILSLSQINFSCANTGAPVTVTLTVPDVNGNTATCTASVTVVDNLPPTTICQNFSVSLDPNGLATIAPSDVDNGSSDNCGAPILSISQTSFDCSNIGVNNVTLTANDASGNASTCTATVAVSSMLMVNAGSDVTICSGSSTQLNATASGANGIAYAWTPTTGLSDANIANPVASPASTTAYTVTASANGCSATDQVTVTVAPAPTATITAANAVCQGNNISLSETGGSPGVTWAWSGPNGFSSTLQNPTITNASPLNAGQYSVAVSNGSGCSATASATVAVNSLPTANAGADVSICAGSTAQLQATGGTGYAWSPAASLNNATIANPIASPTATTTYTVTVTDGNNCTATDTVVVTVTPQPTISGVLADCDANLTTYTIELTSNASQLTASAGIVTNNGGGAWTVSDIQVGTNVTLAATAAGGCTAMQQVTSPNCNCPALAAPSPSGNADVEHCEGLANPAFGVTVGSGETADWYDSPSGGNLLASGVLDFTPLQNTPGVYNFYVETKVIANGCTSLVRTHFTLTILQNPTADAGSDANICTGVSVQLDGSGSSSANGALSYAWSPAASLNDPMLVNPTATPGAATTYTLTVTDPKGCMDDASVNVNISTVNPPLAGANQAICAGATIPALIVSLNGGETADWYSAATGGVLLAQGTASYTPTAAGTFYVETRLLAGGCTSTSRTPISLTINSLPMANATAGSPVCAGGSVQLDASSSLGLAPLNFVWSNGAVIANPVVSPANTTNYTVTVTDGNGCSATAQTTAIVNANPTLTLGSLACDVNLINYSFSVTLGGVDQLTSTAGTVTGAGTSYTVTAPSGQNLQLTATNSFTGCASQQVVTGLVCGCPTILAPVSSGDKTICEGAPTPALSVTVGANETADWFTQAAGGVAAATGTTSFTPNQTAPGIYTYFVETRYTLNSGCLSSTRTPIQLIINALPTANAGNDAAICASETTTLSGSGTGAGSLSYAWSPAILLTNANTATPDFTAASAGLQPFTLTVTDGNGCSATDNVTLDVADKPSLAINSPACNGLSYSVSFTTNADQVAASVGTVTGGAGAFTVTDIPSLTDVSITVTNSTTGCSQGQTVAGISCSCAGLVAVPISGGNQVVCAGATIPALTVTVGVGETANWYDAPTGGTLLTANMTSYTPPVAGTYYAEAVNTAIGCVSDLRMPVVLTINPLPTATITPSGATTFCEGNSVDLTASGGTGFSWSSGETTATISAAATDIYIVTVTGAGGCTATASSNVTVNPTPAATISGDADLCLGENSVLTASGGTGYSWSTGVSSQTITISAAADAVYAVTVTGTGGCTATASVNVAVHALPVADAGADLVFCTNTNGALLDASGSSGVGILNFEWSPSAGLSATDIVNPVASPTVDATYVLTVTDGNGCTSTDEVSVSLHDAPMSVLSTNSPICMNEDLELEETGGEAIAWLWTVPSGSTFASQNPTVPHADVEEGVYSLEITDAFGCSSLTDFDVTLSAGVAFEAKFLTTNVACEGDTVHFIEISQTTTLPDGFSWDFGDGMGSTERDPAHVYTDAGTYQVSVVVTEAGCENFSVAKEININNCRLSGGDDGILSYNLYPTVTSGRLRMDLELQERELLHLDIFDVFGKLVESRTKRDVMHINEEFRIDDPGIYFMHIRTLQGQLTLKFIVVRA